MIATDEFLDRLTRALLPEPPLGTSRGDDDLNPEHLWARPDAPPRAAAVLVPLVAHEAGMNVLLTLRTPHLSSHAGQIAFPGGKIDEADGGPVAAALREAEEETGLLPSFVKPLGFLDGYLTSTHYHVTPVVGLVQPGFVLRPEPSEVEAVFEVPLSFLMDPANTVKHSSVWENRERFYYAMPFGNRYIWGATAGMLKNLRDRMLAS
ncbi:MAG: CoA pyrophosphatase [Aestuariivirgaceae bacterium]|nr:CoA pyrophosphatase [Aestuariivirgaceae bacterium]